MRAAIFHAAGRPLAIENVPDPRPAPDQVIIEVERSDPRADKTNADCSGNLCRNTSSGEASLPSSPAQPPRSTGPRPLRITIGYWLNLMASRREAYAQGAPTIQRNSPRG